MRPRPIAAWLLLTASACAGGTPDPVDPHPSDTCAYCRMVVSDPRLAAQIVAPGEEPRFFDDIGCASNALKQSGVPAGGVVYVADHRTGAWVPATVAVYARVEALNTPMGSHLAAYAHEASRRADRVTEGTVALTAAQVFEGVRLPDVPSR